MATEQLFITLAISLGIGALAAAVSKLASSEPWDGKKFVYALVMGGISGLTIVNGLEGGQVNEGNLVMVILAIFGGSFVATKGEKIVSKLRSEQ